MEIVEIEAQIPIAQFRGPAHIDVGDDAKQITGTFSFANIVEQMGLTLTVRLGAVQIPLNGPAGLPRSAIRLTQKSRSLVLFLWLMRLIQKPSPACLQR